MKRLLSLALVLTLLGTAWLASAAVLNQGSKGAQVTALQNRLKDLRYYQGPIDGVYSQDVWSAVWRYQRDVGLKTDGIAGPQTLSKLGLQTPAARDPRKALTVGDRGDTVRAVQNALKNLKYYDGEVTGVYDNKLWHAVWYYQRDKGMAITGMVDDLLLKALGLPPLNPPPAPKGLTVGSKGATVSALQNAMRTLGYYTGATTGAYDDALWYAVWAYQRDKKLNTTGVADDRLLAALGITVASPPADPAGTLSYGAQSAQVRVLQTVLRNLGYYRMRVDGIFGKGTLAAVQAFQQAYRLTPDGIAGPKTLAALGLTAGTAPAPTPTQPVETPLKHGSQGPAVSALQISLKQLNYYTGAVDGVFGDATYTAVWWFQQLNKLPLTGVADAATLAMLHSGQAKVR